MVIEVRTSEGFFGILSNIKYYLAGRKDLANGIKRVRWSEMDENDSKVVGNRENDTEGPARMAKNCYFPPAELPLS